MSDEAYDRLRAAAPDLLWALEELLELAESLIDVVGDDCEQSGANAMSNAAKAIAKATGR